MTEKFSEILAKDSSFFSRNPVTVVLDDSVFKMWLTNLVDEETLEKCPFYKRWFSGQVQDIVWGFQVVTVGINMGDIFYPLYFECVRKTEESNQTEQKKYDKIENDLKQKYEEKATLLITIQEKNAVATTKEEKKAIKLLREDLKTLNERVKELKKDKKTAKPAKKTSEKIGIAEKLIRRVGFFIEKIRKAHEGMPNLQFSCDNGYSHILLIKAAQESHLNYISVPQKTHIFTINNQKIKLKDWLATTYASAEEAHLLKEKDLPESQKTPFTLRLRVYYQAINQEVTILAFRLKNSKKITVIYTPSKNIFQKTLRRHWFARTQIEQFFKLIKHYLHIEQTRPREKHNFEYKLLRFAFIGLQIQQFIRILRKKRLLPPKSALGALRTLLATEPAIQDLLLSFF